ncbi:MAG: type II toxin-antitoxin system HipA family toxin [Wenzhouxiangellaceae bacterium]|nr:type II toxin-antitoxin system HipA family toxin [Wenzhouxiangellaceae bacterium]
MTALAEVRLWGRTIGAVALAEDSRTAAFEYNPAFVGSGIQVAPLTMPLSERVYRFPELADETFYGLPGLLADSLPDTFGHRLIDAWLARQGRTPDSMNAVERLCYTGRRGMGALEFRPRLGPRGTRSTRLEVDALVELASEVLQDRGSLRQAFGEDTSEKAMADILRVGTSAGGARAKAVIAWNPETNEVRSGQVDADPGFEHWLIKFDGVSGNRDRELDDPQGYCAIEYAYYRMALAAGIEMSECRLFEENGRRHFMTRRFDRIEDGGKLHMQSLCAIAHYDYNKPGAYGYEQAFRVMRQLKLSMAEIEQQYRRMVFNILGRNQDDHVKNIAYLMDQAGHWRLAPAFDLVYSYNPDGVWTARHQMTLNGKRDGFEFADFRACARTAGLKRGLDREIFEQVRSAVARWPEFGREADVPKSTIERISNGLRHPSISAD